MKVDSIEQVLDQLLEEDPRRDADSPTQTTGDGTGETAQVLVVSTLQNTVSGGGPLRVEITDLPPDGLEAREVEVLQPHLRRPRVVEPVRAGEVHGKPLSQRLQSLHALRSLEERGGSR